MSTEAPRSAEPTTEQEQPQLPDSPTVEAGDLHHRKLVVPWDKAEAWAQAYGDACFAAAPPRPAAARLSDADILRKWDTHVGNPNDKYPLTDADKIAFARAIAAILDAPESAPGGQS